MTIDIKPVYAKDFHFRATVTDGRGADSVARKTLPIARALQEKEIPFVIVEYFGGQAHYVSGKQWLRDKTVTHV
jgi:hypothetical protein